MGCPRRMFFHYRKVKQNTRIFTLYISYIGSGLASDEEARKRGGGGARSINREGREIPTWVSPVRPGSKSTIAPDPSRPDG